VQTSDFAVSWIVTIRASRASGGASMGQFGHVTSFLSGRRVTGRSAGSCRVKATRVRSSCPNCLSAAAAMFPGRSPDRNRRLVSRLKVPAKSRLCAMRLPPAGVESGLVAHSTGPAQNRTRTSRSRLIEPSRCSCMPLLELLSLSSLVDVSGPGFPPTEQGAHSYQRSAPARP